MSAADLERLREVRRADVYKGGTLAAVLERRPQGVEFRYRDGYPGPAVATTLPLTDQPLMSPAGAVPPFFAGLLPEGRRMTALRLAVKTSADDDLSLLLAVGSDTIGDVQVVPAGESPTPHEPRVAVGTFDEVRFADLLVAEVGDRALVDRVALPGVQEKVSARMLSLPVATSAGRFILKLDPPEFPHLVENEAFFLEAGRRSGLDVADTRLVHDRDGRPGLLVERFDRPLTPEGKVGMRAQEDGCQVLGRYPADKYNLTAEEVVDGLARHCRARPVAALSFARQVAFAYLTANGDQHAKNLSVVFRGGEWRASPMYDAPSSYAYGDVTMALSVEGRRREDITRRSLVAFGSRVGLTERAVGAMLAELVARVDRWIDELDDLPFDPRTRHKLRRVVEDRATKLGG